MVGSQEYLFDILGTLMLPNEVKVWGGSISKSAQKEFGICIKMFSYEVFKVKFTS